MSTLKIIMYHYVRPIKNSKYPEIKGLEIDAFVRQLDYLQEHFSIVTVEEIQAYLERGVKLPNKPCWLTFDDGYKDHFEYVFPELMRRGLQGSFFPPAAIVTENKLLDVNAIHHILALSPEVSELRVRLDQLCMIEGLDEKSLVNLWDTHGKSNRFDDAETIYVKRLLQHALPEGLRNIITDTLFHETVGLSARDFSKQLYMSKAEIVSMVSGGMYVGSHGSQHYWLDSISVSAQEKDIVDSLDFLESIGAPTSDWIMCYPYGAFNSDTLTVLKKHGAMLGLASHVAEANLDSDDLLALPRYDTNDFPQ